MEYTVNALARLSGVSSRTLRYYDEIGLLKPLRIKSNGYRIYGKQQVDCLQQILFYRQMRIPLEEIKEIIFSPDFNRQQALECHLYTLLAKKEQIEELILNVSKTICSLKGEAAMTDKEKFQGFKEQTVRQNEEKYGEETREKYGSKTVDATNSKLLGMSIEEYQRASELETAYIDALREAVRIGNPTCEKAREACEYHKKWLMCYWTDEMLSEQSHKSLVESYALDDRFKAFYEKIEVGCADFFKNAINEYYSVH